MINRISRHSAVLVAAIRLAPIREIRSYARDVENPSNASYSRSLSLSLSLTFYAHLARRGKIGEPSRRFCATRPKAAAGTHGIELQRYVNDDVLTSPAVFNTCPFRAHHPNWHQHDRRDGGAEERNAGRNEGSSHEEAMNEARARENAKREGGW